MKETYAHEFNWYQLIFKYLLGMWRINKDSIDFKWGYFAPKFGLELLIHRGTYFKDKYAISFCLIWGTFLITLPIRTSVGESCDPPRYGFQIHSNILWLHFGGKMNVLDQCDAITVAWDLPFFCYLHKDCLVFNGKEWISAYVGEYTPPYSDGRVIETYPYKYILKSGEIQNREASCYMEKRIWFRKWFPMFTKTRISLVVDFDGEVGEQTGSWKGGCVGCSYYMLKGETMLDCLKRMEKERKF